MCLHLYQHDGWGSGGTSSQLLCMHIYIHTHVAMIMNSIYIHICIITYMKEGQYICTINEHMCIFYSTHTYMYDHTYILGSLSQLSYCERRCGDITHLHRWTTSCHLIKLYINKVLCIDFNLPVLTYYLTYYGNTCEVLYRQMRSLGGPPRCHLGNWLGHGTKECWLLMDLVGV